MAENTGSLAIYIVMMVAGLVFVALPVIYFGQIDATSAMVLASGIALLIWTAFRMRALKK